MQIEEYKKHMTNGHNDTNTKPLNFVKNGLANSMKTQQSKIKCKSCNFSAPSNALLSYHIKTYNIKIAPEMSNERTLMAQEAMKRDILLKYLLQKEATKQVPDNETFITCEKCNKWFKN